MLEDIRNFLALSEKLLTGGMPTADQLRAASQAGVQLVINLAPFDPARDLPGEGSLVESLGMTYINIPVDWEAPTSEDLIAFEKAMDEHQGQKVLVHCHANFRATGFAALYRVRRLGWKLEAAYKDVLPIWNPEDYPAWNEFIRKNIPAGLQ